MSEVATIALNNFVEFHFRLAMILDHLSSRSGSLTADAEKLVNDYMRQSLEKEFASEDDSCQLRLKFIDSLVVIEKGLSLENLKNMHEAFLSSFS